MYKLSMVFVSLLMLGCQILAAQSSSTSTGATKSSTKPGTKQLPDKTALSKEFREAAMLAELTIEQWEGRVSESNSDRYEEEADKARVVADARIVNSADGSVYHLLSTLYGIVLKERGYIVQSELEIASALSAARRALATGGSTELTAATGFPDPKNDGEMTVRLKYLDCASHIQETLTGAKYIGDGACADKPNQRTKP